MKKLKKEFELFIKNPYYMGSVIIIAIISYGFSTMNIAVSIDDLEGDRYIGSGKVMLAAGRFGMVFWSRICGYGNAGPVNSFAIDVLAVIMLGLSAIIFCMVMKNASGNKISMQGYIVFSCLLISYPLMNEIWEYTGANVCVCGSFLFDAISLNLIWKLINEKQNKLIKINYAIGAILCLMIVSASYESLIVVYIFMVFTIIGVTILFDKSYTKRSVSVITEGFAYAGILICGIGMRFICHRIILLIFNLTPQSNGATEILWGTAPFRDILKQLIKQWIAQYMLRGLLGYFPLTELIIAVLIFTIFGMVIVIKKKNIMLALLGSGMVGSLVLLSIIQGTYSPYRTCQVFTVFVSVSFLILEECCKKINIIKQGAFIVLILLCLHQAVFMNKMLTLNYLRSEEEADVVRNIGRELKTKNLDNKPVYFSGTYSISDNIMQYVKPKEEGIGWNIYLKIVENYPSLRIDKTGKYLEEEKYVDTNINSILYWSTGAFDYDQTAMQKLFQYYGFSYERLTDIETVSEVQKEILTNNMPIYPEAGYIKEEDKYILVRIGQ